MEIKLAYSDISFCDIIIIIACDEFQLHDILMARFVWLITSIVFGALVVSTIN